MPLSKAKQAEYMRNYRKRLKTVIPNIVTTETTTVIPKLPWYAGAGNHFGVIRNEHYARQFFSSLFEGL